jgi:hypothetical protein
MQGNSRYPRLGAYFITKASQKHGSDYSHALSGHGAYLKQYYRDPRERANKYLALEPNILIESVKLETEKTKDKIIDTLQEQMSLVLKELNM